MHSQQWEQKKWTGLQSWRCTSFPGSSFWLGSHKPCFPISLSVKCKSGTHIIFFNFSLTKCYNHIIHLLFALWSWTSSFQWGESLVRWQLKGYAYLLRPYGVMSDASVEWPTLTSVSSFHTGLWTLLIGVPAFCHAVKFKTVSSAGFNALCAMDIKGDKIQLIPTEVCLRKNLLK